MFVFYFLLSISSVFDPSYIVFSPVNTEVNTKFKATEIEFLNVQIQSCLTAAVN